MGCGWEELILMTHLRVGLLMIFAKERVNCPLIHLLKDAERLEEEEGRHAVHARGLSLQRGRDEEGKETPRH